MTLINVTWGKAILWGLGVGLGSGVARSVMNEVFDEPPPGCVITDGIDKDGTPMYTITCNEDP